MANAWSDNLHRLAQCLTPPAGTALGAGPTRTPCGRHAHPAGRLTAADTDPVPAWFFSTRRISCSNDGQFLQFLYGFLRFPEGKHAMLTSRPFKHDSLNWWMLKILHILVFLKKDNMLYIITNLIKHTCPTNWLIWEALQVLHPLVTATQAREAARGICGSQASAPFDLLSALDQSSRTIKKLGL